MSDLQQRFEQLVVDVRKAEGNFQPSNDLKLKIYGWFKQATEGDVNGKRPSRLNLVGRAKWDSWNALQGMSQEEAKRCYVETVGDLFKRFS